MKLGKNKSAQMMIMFAFLFMAMITFLYLIIHLTELSIARIKIQKAVDSAALATATYQARAFNSIADKNYILKYPSGDKKKVHIIGDKNSYSFPGIDQVDINTGFKFKGTSDYDSFFRVIAPHQKMQDEFSEIYNIMIPKISENYAGKNDKDFKITKSEYPTLNFQREHITVKYTITDDDKKIFERENIVFNKPAWMSHEDRYIYSLIEIKKEVNIWDQKFTLSAIALAEVVKKDAQIWPEPKPKYVARLAPTQER